MSTFIGTKILKAQSMTLGMYNEYRGWEIPENEDPDTRGYLVEYMDGGEPNDPRHEGYISWSPADVFEGHYQPTTAMNFGHALEMLKRGMAVSRSGWNGKGMFLYLVPANAYLPTTKIGETLALGADEKWQGHVPYAAYIAMRTVDGTVVPWLCSQTDALADDWGVIKIGE